MNDSILVAGPNASGRASMSERHSDLSARNKSDNALKEHTNDSILREIRKRMGNNADLLRYLPLDNVRIERLSEDIRPASAMPYQIHFGSIREPSYVAGQVRIILQAGRPADGPPEMRYHILSRDGSFEKTITAVKACQGVIPEPAFRCVMDGGIRDTIRIRTVVKYYFIARRCDLGTTWVVNDDFIAKLVSACQMAKLSVIRSTEKHPSQDGIATQAYTSHSQRRSLPETLFQARPEVCSKGPSHEDHPKDTYEDRWLSSISRDKGRKSRYSGPYISGQPLDDDEPYQAMLTGTDKENVPGRGLDKNFATSFAGSNDTRETRPHTVPRSSASNNVRSALFPARDGANDMLRDPSISAPSSASAASRPIQHKSPVEIDIKDHIDFIARYGRMLEDEERYNFELKEISTEQVMTTSLMEKCREKLATLQAKERKVKNERHKGMDEKKRLRESLSESERTFLSYGMELGKKHSKRAKLGDGMGHEGDDAEE